VSILKDKWTEYKSNEIPYSLKPFPIIHAYLKPNHNILDIGTGTGRIAIEFGKNGYTVHGVDINENGIQKAIKFTEKQNLSERVKFKVGSATNLPYEDEMFDMVIIQAVLTCIVKKEDRDTIFKEIHRVLKPEGFVYVAAFGQTWRSELYRKRYLRDFPKTNEQGSFFCYNRKTGEFEYIAHHYTEKELVFLLLNNRFRILEFQNHEFTTRNGNKTNGFVVIARK
jgi:ubiquinone/menaquinone biosynthesis C-methylase UbiE